MGKEGFSNDVDCGGESSFGKDTMLHLAVQPNRSLSSQCVGSISATFEPATSRS